MQTTVEENAKLYCEIYTMVAFLCETSCKSKNEFR